MQKETCTAYWKSRDNTWKTKFNAIENGKMCKNPTITTYWKSSESVRKIYSLPTKEAMRANGTKTMTTPYWTNSRNIRNTIIMRTMTASVLTYLLFRNDNICKIASIEQWSPAVCGKPILFHIERAVSRNLNRSSDCDAIAYWESNDSSTKHILFLRNGW